MFFRTRQLHLCVILWRGKRLLTFSYLVDRMDPKSKKVAFSTMNSCVAQCNQIQPIGVVTSMFYPFLYAMAPGTETANSELLPLLNPTMPPRLDRPKRSPQTSNSQLQKHLLSKRLASSKGPKPLVLQPPYQAAIPFASFTIISFPTPIHPRIRPPHPAFTT